MKKINIVDKKDNILISIDYNNIIISNNDFKICKDEKEFIIILTDYETKAKKKVKYNQGLTND